MSAYYSRLRVRRRIIPAATLYRRIRTTITVALVFALVVSGFRYFTSPSSVEALEFTPHIVGNTGQVKGALGVDIADVDSDGDVDIVSSGNSGIWVFVNQGNGTYEGVLVDNVRGQRVQVIDLNNDGLPDILATLDETPSAVWYKNEGGLEFNRSFLGTGKNARAAAADVNGDQIPDIVTATEESGVYVMRVWVNDGSGGFTSSTLPSTGNPTITALGIGNLSSPKLSNPGDTHYPDIVVSGSEGVQIFETSDGVAWTRFDLDNDAESATHLTVADITGDGYNDIITGIGSSDTILVYRNIENKQFNKFTVNPGADVATVVVKDLDEDGDNDIIVAAQDDHSIFWYDNNGSTEFTKRTLATGITSVLGVAVADLDDDGDFDFTAGDHTVGTMWWYERTRAKPVATEPSNIQQTVDGAGRITFDTTLSDGDYDATRIRVQYSLDGDHWYKPWLIKVTPQEGSVDLKNSNGYQVGTSDAIDTDDNDSVKLTLIWDTKSSGNTGGPITGDIGNVQLRIIPRDDQSIGFAAVSNGFRVDNSAPQNLTSLSITNIGEDQVSFSWPQAKDSSSFTYKIYYGTDHAKVLEQKSDVWDGDDDPLMNDIEGTSTTITDLSPNTSYSFKIFVTDEFGNTVGAPSVTAKTGSAGSGTPTPTPAPGTGTPTPTPAPGTEGTPTPTPTPGASASPTPLFSVSPSPSPSPTFVSTTFNNQPPVADAGIDQIVNPSALVILDGTASVDVDGDQLTYSWKQLSGPTVELFSERTATPSFSAGGENETYIFALTVRDQVGASATDAVTIAVRALPTGDTAPVQEDTATPGGQEPVQDEPVIISALLRPLDIFLFVLALILTAISITERVLRSIRQSSNKGGGALAANTPKGRVVHFRTNEPIAGATVLVYGADNKLRSQVRTNDKGEFATLFPPGEYSIQVQAENFAFAPAASLVTRPEEGIQYSGGKITVPPGGRPLNIVIPMKPAGAQIGSARSRTLHLWQTVQRLSRLLSWPIFITGSLLNTALIFWVPGGLFLIMEVLYVALVIIKVALEVRIRPAYGLVRDSITHVPVDLAVVRLFEKGTNKIVMTRVTDGQGKFFALPEAGTYTITITKPGYAVFSRENVSITSQQDSVLQLTADLMPVTPTGGLAGARAATL